MRVLATTNVLCLLVLVWIALQLPAPRSDVAMLHEELRQLSARLLAREAVTPAPAPSTPALGASSPAPAAAREEVGPDLIERLVVAAEALAAAGARMAGDAHAVPELPRTPLPAAVQELGRRWDVDEQAVRREHLLMGLRDVLGRYGSPDSAYADQKIGLWCYYRQGPLRVGFHLVDGVVVHVDVDRR